MKIHIVKKGDTLYFLAQKYDIPLQKLIDANPDLKDPNQLDVGMKIKIPVEAKPVKPEYEMMHKHEVKKGDTLWKLSKAWGIPIQDMIKANPQLKDPNILNVGDIVFIPKVTGVTPGVPPVQPSMTSTTPSMSSVHPTMTGSTPSMPPTMPPMTGSTPSMPPAMPPMANSTPNMPPAMSPMANSIPSMPSAMAPMANSTPSMPSTMSPMANNIPSIPFVQPPMTAVTTNVPMMPSTYPGIEPTQAMYSFPQGSHCGCNSHLVPTPYGQPYEAYSEDLFSQFQVPATEAISLYDLPQVPEMATASHYGNYAPHIQQSGFDGYPDPYGMHMYPPLGYPGVGYGMPAPSFNPYSLPYGDDMYGMMSQPMYDHAPGCGCGHCQQREEAQKFQQDVSTPLDPEVNREASKSSTKAKAKTSASSKTNKSRPSKRRKSKPRKTSSIPWING